MRIINKNKTQDDGIMINLKAAANHFDWFFCTCVDQKVVPTMAKCCGSLVGQNLMIFCHFKVS